ncbi:MAG: type IX secretion system membrane protein PorP/SprF [Cyanobacteria bacterium J06638_22]
MKTVSIFLLILSLFSLNAYGQQDPNYTQYMYNMNIVNPAYAGSKGTLSIGLLGRSQWAGIDGAPESITANVNAPVGRNLGIGLSAITDRLGPVQEQNVYADLSYTVQLSRASQLAFGLKGGVTIYDADLTNIILPENDIDAVFGSTVNEAFPNIGAGIFYYTERFYAGLSAPNMLNSLHFERNALQISRVAEVTNYFFTTGYVFYLSDQLKFKPSTLLKAVQGAPVSVDVSANFLFNDRFELGANYRFDDSISLLAMFGIGQGLRIGAAYDLTLSNLSDFNNGTYEIGIYWDLAPKNRALKSPRFF